MKIELFIQTGSLRYLYIQEKAPAGHCRGDFFPNYFFQRIQFLGASPSIIPHDFALPGAPLRSYWQQPCRLL